MSNDDTFTIPATQGRMTGTTHGRVIAAKKVQGRYGSQLELTLLTDKGNTVIFWLNLTSFKAVDMGLKAGVLVAVGEGLARVRHMESQPTIYLELKAGRFVKMEKYP
jgi:hypothetical protein